MVSAIRRVTMDELGNRQESLVKNISEKGLFLETEEKFEAGDFVFAEMRLPIKFQNATVLGVVRWNNTDPAGIGVEEFLSE